MRKLLISALVILTIPATGFAVTSDNTTTPDTKGTQAEHQHAPKKNETLTASAAESINPVYQCANSGSSAQSGYKYTINATTSYSVLYTGQCKKAVTDTKYYTCKSAIFGTQTLPDGRKKDSYFDCTSPYPDAEHINHLSFVRPAFSLPTNFDANDLGPGDEGLKALGL